MTRLARLILEPLRIPTLQWTNIWRNNYRTFKVRVLIKGTLKNGNLYVNGTGFYGWDIQEVLHLISWVAWAWGPLLINKQAPLGDHLYVLNSSVCSTEELSPLLFNSTEEQNIIIQPSTMIDIAPPMLVHRPSSARTRPSYVQVTVRPYVRCQRCQRPLSRSPRIHSHLPPLSIIYALCPPSSLSVLHAPRPCALSMSVPFILSCPCALTAPPSPLTMWNC